MFCCNQFDPSYSHNRADDVTAELREIGKRLKPDSFQVEEIIIALKKIYSIYTENSPFCPVVVGLRRSCLLLIHWLHAIPLTGIADADLVLNVGSLLANHVARIEPRLIQLLVVEALDVLRLLRDLLLMSSNGPQQVEVFPGFVAGARRALSGQEEGKPARGIILVIAGQDNVSSAISVICRLLSRLGHQHLDLVPSAPVSGKLGMALLSLLSAPEIFADRIQELMILAEHIDEYLIESSVEIWMQVGETMRQTPQVWEVHNRWFIRRGLVDLEEPVITDEETQMADVTVDQRKRDVIDALLGTGRVNITSSDNNRRTVSLNLSHLISSMRNSCNSGKVEICESMTHADLTMVLKFLTKKADISGESSTQLSNESVVQSLLSSTTCGGVLQFLQTRSVAAAASIAELSSFFAVKSATAFNKYEKLFRWIPEYRLISVPRVVGRLCWARDTEVLSQLATREECTVPELVVNHLQYPLLIQVLSQPLKENSRTQTEAVGSFITSQILTNQYTLAQLMDASISEVIVALLREIAKLNINPTKERYVQSVNFVSTVLDSIHALVGLAAPVIQQAKRTKTAIESPKGKHNFLSENYLHLIQLIEDALLCEPEVKGAMLAILIEVVGESVASQYAIRTVETIIKLNGNLLIFWKKKLWKNFFSAIENHEKVLVPLVPVLAKGLIDAGDTRALETLLEKPGVDIAMKKLFLSQIDAERMMLLLESELREDRILSSRISLLEQCNVVIGAADLRFTKSAPAVVRSVLSLVRHNMENSELISVVTAFICATGPFMIDADDSVGPVDSDSEASALSLSDGGKIKQFIVGLLTQFLIPNLRMDSHAFAVQELLATMGGNSFVSTFFTKDTILVLTPYLSSSYRASVSVIAEVGSIDSLEDMYLYLTSQVTNEKARNVLEYLRIAVARDIGLCIHLIPYILEVVAVDISEGAVDEVVGKIKSGFKDLLRKTDKRIEINCIFKCMDFLKSILFSKRKLTSKESRFLTLLVETDVASLELMVAAATAVNDFARALQYHELKLGVVAKQLAQTGVIFDVPELHTLCEIYDKLNWDPGVLGACSLVDRKTFSTEIEEIKLEKSGKYTELLALLDSSAKADIQRRIRVLVASGHYRAATDAARSEVDPTLSDKVYEACWKLGEFEFVKDQRLTNPSFDSAICGLIPRGMVDILKIDFLKQMAINKNSTDVTKMYLLSLREREEKLDISPLVPYMHPSCRELVLQAAHVVSSRSVDENYFKIELLRHYRKSGSFANIRQLVHPARPAISHNMSEELWRRHCEWGKACWAIGDRGLAADGLRQAMAVDGSGTPNSWQAELLVLKWSAEMELLIPKLVVSSYRDLMRRALKRDAKDKGSVCFAFAEYLDKVGMNSVLSSGSADIWNKQVLVREATQNYFESIKFDSSGKRILFTLNRLFQLHWELSHSGDANQIKYSSEIVNVIQAGWKLVPEWVWYIALPQLMARIVGSIEFSPIIEDIVASVTAQYPRQASWIVVPQLLSSKNQERREVGLRVLQKVIEKSNYPNIQSLVSVMRVVSESLVAVSKFEGTGSGLMRTLSESKEGARLLRDTGGLLVMPVKSQVSPSAILSCGLPPFSNEVRISRFQDPVHVYNTKAKPKRISVMDSTGKALNFILKLEKKTDLRKDSRMMDFVNVVNQEIFNRGGDSKLLTTLRTYSVLTLSEDSALIEFIPNLITMRKIIDESLCRMGKSVSLYLNKEVMNKLSNKNEGFAYFQSIVETIPPMIAEWFGREFIEPQRWLRARTTFTKSQAMWSIVGHIVGLGDRHPDNILIDTASGEVVHVDFDCLFSRGMILNIPELVPFRLTKICVSAMGITGIEGTFRLSCEQIMSLMRDKKRMLLAVLHAFIADPLIDWQGNGTSYRKARDVIGAIEKKLNGYVDVGEMRVAISAIPDEKLILYNETSEKNSGLGKDRGAALSVEGQVDELIRAAVCPRNLAKMYLGWMPLF